YWGWTTERYADWSRGDCRRLGGSATRLRSGFQNKIRGELTGTSGPASSCWIARTADPRSPCAKASAGIIANSRGLASKERAKCSALPAGTRIAMARESRWPEVLRRMRCGVDVLV